MRKIFYICFIILSVISSTKAQTNKTYFPTWTFHKKNIEINGLSFGLWSTLNDERQTNTNGIRLEVPGLGLAILLAGSSPIAHSDSAFQVISYDIISERINGINFSALGSICNCNINGISIGLFSQVTNKVNGISTAFYSNFSQVSNGLQLAGGGNESFISNGFQISAIGNQSYYSNGMQLAAYNYSEKHKGIQIGIINKSVELYGLQIGLWNINQKRKLPFLNWNFRKEENNVH
jgi:hypothetical protein